MVIRTSRARLLTRRRRVAKKEKTMLRNVWEGFLPGYKTYIVVAVMLVIVVAEQVFGVKVPGVSIGDDWLQAVLVALGFGGLRAGVAGK
jgi:hypothetical protein